MHVMHIRGVDLNLLLVLDALLAERSVTRAARRVGLSQPATSHALARLRSLLGDELLLRDGPNMQLTPRAATLIGPVADAVRAVTSVLAGPQAFDPKSVRRTLRFASTDFLQVLVFPSLLARLASDAPGVDLLVVPSSTRMQDGLLAGEIDFAIGPLRDRDVASNLRSQKLFDERFVSMVRRGHPLLSGRLTPQRFAQARHAFIAPRGTRGGVVDDALRAHGLERRVVLQSAQFLVSPFVIADSDLVITLPERVAAMFERSLDLVTFAPPLLLEGFSISLAWHVRSESDPLSTLVRELLLEIGRELAATHVEKRPRARAGRSTTSRPRRGAAER